MGTTLRQSSIILIAALALSGCSHYRGKVEPWVWPGANRFNTLAFAQSGTRPAPALRYVEAWDAEWFDVSATEPVPASARAEHRPLVADLDRDGHLEIVTSPLAQSPATILNLEGAPLSGRARGGTNWDRVRSDSARIIADDSAGWVVLPESSRSRPGSSPLALRLNQRVVTLQAVTEPGPLSPSSGTGTAATKARNARNERVQNARSPFHSAFVTSWPSTSDSGPRRMLECRDGGSGRLMWQYEFRARPDLMAAADLNSDGREELLFATYGEGGGAAANGTRDHDSCYCVALRDDGTRLWQRGFGAHPFIGCSAGVADLDQNGKPDVFVAVYSWLNDFGGLAVLDGATGEVMAESPGRDSSPVSCVSAGCADVDGDGRQELAVAVCGKKAEVRLYRLAENRLTLAQRVTLGEARDSNEVSECRLHAICDLDGDGKSELVVSRCRKQMICKDPMFYPSTFDSCGLLILGADLRKRQEIPLPLRCQDVTLGDVIPGGNIELLVITDRLRLYSTEAE